MMVRVTNSSKSVPKADVATGAGGRQPQNTARRRCHHLSYCTIYRCSRHSQTLKYYRNSQANQHIKLAILEKALIQALPPYACTRTYKQQIHGKVQEVCFTFIKHFSSNSRSARKILRVRSIKTAMATQ